MSNQINGAESGNFLAGHDILFKSIARANAFVTIRAANPSADLIQAFGLVAANSPDCKTISDLDEATRRVQFNPKTQLMYEHSGRSDILRMINEQVIHGNKELAVIDTDMKGLKGINDNYKDEGGDKAIAAFADRIKSSFIQKMIESGNDFKFAIVNLHQQGSDSIRIVITGDNLYNFVQDYVQDQEQSNFKIQIQRKIGEINDDVDIKGGWGFFVLKRDQINKATSGLANQLTPAGEIYYIASELASEKMDEKKVREDAVLANDILNAQSLDELAVFRKRVYDLGPRVSSAITDHIFDRMESFLKK